MDTAPRGSAGVSSTSTMLAVIDMGATAVRLTIAEHNESGPIRVLEEASRALLLGRDTFSRGVIGSETMEAALKALEGFQNLMRPYEPRTYRAVATSAVREARNADTFLDRIHIRTGLVFDVISESEESRLVYLAVRDSLEHHPAMQAVRSLVVEVGGGSAALTLLTVGRPRQAGVYGLGAVRVRQGLGLSRQDQPQRLALLKRYIGNVVNEIEAEMPLENASWLIAVGGDVRWAVAQMTESGPGVPSVSRDAFLAFCDALESETEDSLAERHGLSTAEAETVIPAMLVYRALLAETAATHVVVPSSSLRLGMLIDMTGDDHAALAERERQVLANAEVLGRRYRFDAPHGHAVMTLASRLFELLQPEHGLGPHERLLLRVAALLHDIGNYVSLRQHHKHTHYLLSASQIFGLSDDDVRLVANIARYHRRGLPQTSHLPFIALDRQDRMTVSKLAAILRLANALDAEHLQKVRELRLERTGHEWVLALEGTGDLTMECRAAQARSDMFSEVFGQRLIVRGTGAHAS